MAFVVVKLLIFKCFLRTRKFHFRLLPADNSSKCSWILCKFGPVMQCKLMYIVWYSPENSEKLSLKTWLFCFFSEVFWLHSLTPYELRQCILPNERSHENTQSWKSLQEPLENITQGKNLFSVVLILLRQHCTGKNSIQCCLNTFGTTLYR